MSGRRGQIHSKCDLSTCGRNKARRGAGPGSDNDIYDQVDGAATIERLAGTDPFEVRVIFMWVTVLVGILLIP